ncbi:hypothetical protein QE152_g18168 [Popillia japonica]|uniref:Uncharacterized protein n=1 Tax=Popillia japonica TaxID=7064 RepID=A0AAW1L095_POPJA
MPKIIVCDGKKKKKLTPKLNLPSQQMQTCPPCIMPSVMPQFAQRLTESYNMQEKLAAENADLEGKRYQLQEDLLDKDQTVESLQRKLTSLQAEMRMIVKENNLLNDKLEKAQENNR